MKAVLTFLVVVFALTPDSCSTARILGVFCHPLRSNAMIVHGVMSTLAAAGHNVTVYSTILPRPDAGFRHVHVTTEIIKSKVANLNYEDYVKTFRASGFANSLLRTVAHHKTESFLKHPKVQHLLHSNDVYDLVVTGATFGEEALLVFGHKFRAPVTAVLPMSTCSVTDYMAGNAVSLAIAPEYMAYPFTDKMTFYERLQNVMSASVNFLMYFWYDLPGQDAILKRHASSLKPPPVDQMARDIALTFVNVHPTLSYPKPLPPNVVLIGGIHVEPRSPPLPENIKKIMDDSKEGVILFSLGSVIPIDSMPRHLLQAFLNSFKKIPQKVIWKVSSKNLPKLPDNVVVSSWLPQQRILEHPNLKLFFTHGGLGSHLEALKAGVPLVGLPYLADQPHNVRQFETLGMGVRLDLDTLSEETITSALQTVLNNSSYAENARRVARLYADRPMEPQDLVVYWTEYVLRHGAAHLRPQAALMPWYQRFLLDIVLVLVMGLIVTLAVVVNIGYITYSWGRNVVKLTIKQKAL